MNAFQAIAAMSRNRVIGCGNRIPWHLPEDFKWFKQKTTGHIIVMGRKTFESIGKPLPNRETIVLSRSDFRYPGVRVIRRLEDLNQGGPSAESHVPARLNETSKPAEPVLGASIAPDQRQIFICGGAQVYQQALPLCSDLFLTLVKREVEGDAFFPPFENEFQLAEELRDAPEFKILHYRRRR